MLTANVPMLFLLLKIGLAVLQSCSLARLHAHTHTDYVEHREQIEIKKNKIGALNNASVQKGKRTQGKEEIREII